MNIKYISLLSLLFVTGAYAILPRDIIDVAYSRYARAHQALLTCQQSKDVFGRPCQCINEKNEVATKRDEYNKVMSHMKDFLDTTVQQGNEATIFERSKRQKAKMAQKVISTINTYEQQPKAQGMGKFSGDLLSNSSNNIIDMPGDKETREQFDHDLYNTIPSYNAYDFIHTY